MTNSYRYYFADIDGRRVLVTPWPMLANEGRLEELSEEQLTLPHYRAVVDDATHFYGSAGARSAVLLYEVETQGTGQPAMVGSFWLTGPLSAAV